EDCVVMVTRWRCRPPWRRGCVKFPNRSWCVRTIAVGEIAPYGRWTNSDLGGSTSMDLVQLGSASLLAGGGLDTATARERARQRRLTLVAITLSGFAAWL